MVTRGRLGRFGKRHRAGFAGVVVATALFWCSAAGAAETKVLLFRGWFGVFSTGLDSIAKELKAKGIDAQVAGHLASSKAAAEIVKSHASGTIGPIVLVGHSQGANNVIEMAHALETANVPVDLLVTLAPFMQDPVPANVVHAINYYQAPGWGAPLEGAPGFRGKLTNNDMAADLIVSHITIDKSSKVQAEIVREVVALQGKEVASALPRAPARAR
jgi:hypothetical protein